MGDDGLVLVVVRFSAPHTGSNMAVAGRKFLTGKFEDFCPLDMT